MVPRFAEIVPRLSSLPRLLGFGCLYGASAAAGILIGRIDAGVAFLWIATGVLVARLSVIPTRRWPAHAAVALVGSAVATGLVGVGWAAAAPLALANVGEALVGAWVLRRLVGEEAPIDSLGWLGGYLLALGILGPLAGGVTAGAAMAMLTAQPLAETVGRWYIGHALGTIAIAPLLMFAFAMRRGDWMRVIRGRKAAETTGLLGLVAATSVLVFAQSRFPLLFLPMLPIMLATFRGGRVAAAMSLAILTIVGAAFSLQDIGPLALVPGSHGLRMQLFQFYLAATVLTVLPIAADLANRSRLFRELRQSEARYRLVTENTTDIVMNVDRTGIVRYCSPSIEATGGPRVADVVGSAAIELVDPSHRARVLRAHVEAIEHPARTVTVEYIAPTLAGEPRWYETHTRAVLDDAGEAMGVVSAIRDISHRKAVEERLHAAASTDPLTGLPNRRAFFDALGACTGAGQAQAGCVAMLDLDHFKRINDRSGHAAGDAVLRRFAEIAPACLRAGDTIARIGGEEFALLLPGATIAQAEFVVERLRTAVRTGPALHGSLAIFVTVSAGIASYGPGCEDPDVLRRADEALYAAKADGRDRLAVAA